MLDVLTRRLGLGSLLSDLRARSGPHDGRRRAPIAVLAAALVIAAGCVSPGPVVEAGGASNRAADSQVRDTPLVAAHAATTLCPPLPEASGRGGSNKLLQMASPGGHSDELAVAGQAETPERTAWTPRAQVLLPGSPRGPPAT